MSEPKHKRRNFFIIVSVVAMFACFNLYHFSVEWSNTDWEAIERQVKRDRYVQRLKERERKYGHLRYY